MEIPFINPNPGPEGQYPINCYFVPETNTGNSALIGTAGCLAWSDLSKVAEGRGAFQFKTQLYVVCGNNFYSVTTLGVVTANGTTLDTSTGPVWMECNGTQVMIIDGAYGYIYTIATGVLAKITDVDFPVPTTLTRKGVYFIVTESGTGRFYISASNNGTSWSATDYATAESNPDDATAAFQEHEDLFLFGPESIEVWYDSGDTVFPFEKKQGIFIERGLGSSAGVCKGDNSLFFLDQYRQFVRLDGYTPKVISPPELNRLMDGYSIVSDCRSWCIAHRGNSFVTFTFPTANKTWQYNCLTQKWHELRSYQDGNVDDGRHRSNWHCFFNNKHLVGDHSNGKIYELSYSTYQDNGEVLRMIRTTPEMYADGKRMFFSNLEFLFESGVGLVSGQGSDPQVMLDWSDNGGKTWNSEYWTSLSESIGALGEYSNRCRFPGGLGSSFRRIWRITITDPVKRCLYKTHGDVEAGL